MPSPESKGPFKPSIWRETPDGHIVMDLELAEKANRDAESALIRKVLSGNEPLTDVEKEFRTAIVDEIALAQDRKELEAAPTVGRIKNPRRKPKNPNLLEHKNRR